MKKELEKEIAVEEGKQTRMVQIRTPRDIETNQPLEDKIAISISAKGDIITIVFDKEELDL